MSYLKSLRTPGRHETTIKRQFGSRVRFEGATPVFDKPLILMAFTNRCGSHLLADYLRQTGQLAGFGEYLNHDVVANQSAEHGYDSFPDYIAGLQARICLRGQALGLKGSYDQIAMLLRWNIGAMFRGVRVVHILREDALAQAVSLSIARQTEKWTSHQTGNGAAPTFQPKLIESILQSHEAANTMIGLLAQAAALPRMQISYEQVMHDPATYVRRLFGFCGVEAPDWVPRVPTVKKQADALNAEFAQAYRAQVLREAGINSL
ncbi:Stf0 family sulfotransferase [Sulfitobacter sp. 20_GPM-1509m]|jgi:LPS sulfotransferase NodH|uniref:Stf0 family sulfotransferase n=1 Tax=Sulfitobacter sp. 20_GPM-1509m TaxID=1380367 RepID=UPI00048CC18B|nr:Stf0 family sulfotransferase [Sulfitobacter sp. 20_GPM-1509m]|tara:strand:+ start:349 stop:1137 length:789 start_codon:yes stop_codon:yes gene_type:complete